MKKRILKNMEWGIVICTILLIAIGLVALTSATKNSDYEELKKQTMWIAISIPLLIVVIFIDYNIIAKMSPVLYRHNNYITNSCAIYRCSKWSN